MTWDGRLHVAARWALYLGPGETTPAHAHVPAKWVIGDHVRVGSPGHSSRAGAVLVPPSTPHSVEPGPTEVMLVYLEPGAVLTPEQTSRLREAWAARSFERALGELANLPRSEELRGAIPARVRLADDLLRHGESLASAAGRLGLSVGRFSHVVAEAVGAPPSRLRAWHRLRTAVRAIAGGASATEAAHFAGYSDSAHFSRHCRATLAVTPTMLRRSDLTLDEADAGSVA